MSDLEGYRRSYPGTQPAHLHPLYVSSIKRAPSKPLVRLSHTISEITGPCIGHSRIDVKAFDLTKQHHAEPLGERIVVSGRVLDENGRPVPHALVEIWQANAAGRYIHKKDQWDAPIDPNFTGAGRAITDAEGRYSFVSIRPGAYPWKNHHNAWRPAHIHFSLMGPAFATRLITQMYFPDDPLIAIDPIAAAVPKPYRARMIARFELALTRPDYALGYRFDLVLRGRTATPFEAAP